MEQLRTHTRLNRGLLSLFADILSLRRREHLQIAVRPVLAGAILGLLCSTANGEPRGQGVSLQEAIERATWWRSQIVNVRFSCKVCCPESIREQMPNLSNDEIAGWFRRQEFTWADSGILWQEFRRYRSGSLHDSEIYGGNAKLQQTFRAQYVYHDGRRNLSEIKIEPLHLMIPTSNVIVTPLQGLFFPGAGMWLGERLQEAEFVEVGPAHVDGVDCLHFNLDGADFYLDSTCDYLPRRIVFDKGKDYESEFVVVEFQKVDPGIWFPRNGYYRNLSSRLGPDRWHISELEINQDLDLAEFTTPLPEMGTIVEDRITGDHYRHGDNSVARERRVAWSAKKGGVLFDSPNAPVGVRSTAVRWIAAGLSLLALVSFGLAELNRRRLRTSAHRSESATSQEDRDVFA